MEIIIKPENIIWENNKIVGAKTSNGEKIYIPEWEYELLATFENYSILLPYKREVQLINPIPYFDIDSGTIIYEYSYWEKKIFFEKNTIIKEIRHNLPNLCINRIPLGRKVRTKICIFLQTNRRNAYIKKVVFKIYILHANPNQNEKEIKIEYFKKNCIFEFYLPTINRDDKRIKIYINEY